jgi:hypothetical protein
MERMPCGQFEANVVFFRIGVLAYNAFTAARADFWHGTAQRITSYKTNLGCWVFAGPCDFRKIDYDARLSLTSSARCAAF